MNGLFRYFYADCLGKKIMFKVEKLNLINKKDVIEIANNFDDLKKVDKDRAIIRLRKVLESGLLFYNDFISFMNDKQASNQDFCWGGLLYIKKMYKTIEYLDRTSPDNEGQLEPVFWGLDIKRYYENIIWEIVPGMEKYATDYMQVPFWESVYVSSGNLLIKTVIKSFQQINIPSSKFTTMEGINYTKTLMLSKGVEFTKSYELTQNEVVAIALRTQSIKSIFDVSIHNKNEDSVNTLILNFDEISAILALIHSKMECVKALIELQKVLESNKRDDTKIIEMLNLNQNILLESSSKHFLNEQDDKVMEVEVPKEKYFKKLEEAWVEGYSPVEVVKDLEEVQVWDKDDQQISTNIKPITYYKGEIVEHQQPILIETIPLCKRLSMLKNKDALAGSLIENILIYITGLSCEDAKDRLEIAKQIDKRSKFALNS